MQQYSTFHALINITENMRKALDGGNIGCGNFVDLQKAFDNVDHKILLAKLNHCGIHGVLFDWFKFYLSNYNQYVSVNGYESILTIYIHDLNQAIKFWQVHHFADDTNLLCLGDSIKKLNKLVNADLKQLANWINTKKILPNIKKTEMVIFKSKHL